MITLTLDNKLNHSSMDRRKFSRMSSIGWTRIW